MRLTPGVGATLGSAGSAKVTPPKVGILDRAQAEVQKIQKKKTVTSKETGRTYPEPTDDAGWLALEKADKEYQDKQNATFARNLAGGQPNTPIAGAGATPTRKKMRQAEDFMQSGTQGAETIKENARGGDIVNWLSEHIEQPVARAWNNAGLPNLAAGPRYGSLYDQIQANMKGSQYEMKNPPVPVNGPLPPEKNNPNSLAAAVAELGTRPLGVYGPQNSAEFGVMGSRDATPMERVGAGLNVGRSFLEALLGIHQIASTGAMMRGAKVGAAPSDFEAQMAAKTQVQADPATVRYNQAKATYDTQFQNLVEEAKGASPSRKLEIKDEIAALKKAFMTERELMLKSKEQPVQVTPRAQGPVFKAKTAVVETKPTAGKYLPVRAETPAKMPTKASDTLKPAEPIRTNSKGAPSYISTEDAAHIHSFRDVAGEAENAAAMLKHIKPLVKRYAGNQAAIDEIVTMAGERLANSPFTGATPPKDVMGQMKASIEALGGTVPEAPKKPKLAVVEGTKPKTTQSAVDPAEAHWNHQVDTPLPRDVVMNGKKSEPVVIKDPAPKEPPPKKTVIAQAEPSPKAGVSELGVPEHGKPWTFKFARNPEKAPGMGTQYGQDIEPAGKYMVATDTPPQGWESGSKTFKKPLVIEFGDGYQAENSWKRVLSKKYGGKTGKELSDAIRADGYDGIVTHDKYGTQEIIDLAPKVETPPAPKAEPTVPKVAEKGPAVHVKAKTGNWMPQSDGTWTQTVTKGSKKYTIKVDPGESSFNAHVQNNGAAQVLDPNGNVVFEGTLKDAKRSLGQSVTAEAANRRKGASSASTAMFDPNEYKEIIRRAKAEGIRNKNEFLLFVERFDKSGDLSGWSEAFDREFPKYAAVKKKDDEQSTSDKVRAGIKASRLTNPKSMLQDVAGNVVSGGSEAIISTADGVFDRILFPRLRKAQGAASGALLRDLPTVKGLSRKIGGELVKQVKGQRDMETRYAMGPAPKAAQAIYNIRGIADVPNEVATYETVKAQLKRLQPNMPEKEIEAIAKREASEAIFANDNNFADGWKDMQKAIGKSRVGGLINAGLDSLVPFPKVPSNVSGRVAQYTPAGYFDAIAQLRKAVKSGNVDIATRRSVNRTMSRATAGMGLAYLGYKLVEAGMKPEEIKKEGKYIKWGGTPLMDYDQLGPQTNLFYFGAGIAAIAKAGLTKNQKEGFYKSLAASLIMDNPFSRGSQNLAAIKNNPTKGAAKIATQHLTPGFLRWVNELIDFANGDRGVERKTNGVVDEIKKQIPGLSQTLPKK